MDITRENYQIRYDEEHAIVSCQGSFRLHDSEYKPILELLIGAADTLPATLTLDLRKLRFLNSAGIHTLLKFIIRVREHKVSQVVVHGSSEFPWQAKSLKNLQRLLPSVQMDMS